VARVVALEEQIASTTEESKKYARALHESQREFEKQAMLLGPEQWTESMYTLFSGTNRGANLEEVNYLLTQFEQVYNKKVEQHRATLATVRGTTQLAGKRKSVNLCMDKLFKVEMRLTEVELLAEDYQTQLSEKKQQLLELIDKINSFNSMAAEFDVMVDKQVGVHLLLAGAG
jgi:hypothetical protein